MINLPYVSLPQSFSRLLCRNMNATGSGFSSIKKIFLEEKGLHAVAKKAFYDVDQNAPINTVILSMGWETFRNRLAASYLHYQMEGHYPVKVDLSLVSDLVAFEEKTSEFIVGGVSRNFLLAFYYKMALIEKMKLDPKEKVTNFLIGDKVTTLLKKSNVRTVKLDWVLLSLFHFDHFLGSDALAIKLDAKENFNNLYGQMKSADQKIMMENMVCYGASIGEDDIFYAESI